MMSESRLKRIINDIQADDLTHELAVDLLRCREALLAVRRRAHFIGHPGEPMTAGFLRPTTVPDWSKEISIIDAALFVSK